MVTENDDDVTLPLQKPPAAPAKGLGRYELLDRLGKGGTRSDMVGNVDLRVEPRDGKTGDQFVDLPLRGAGPPTADASRPRSHQGQAVVAVVLVAVSWVGGYYTSRVLSGDLRTTSVPTEEAHTVDDGAGEGAGPVMLQVTSTPPGAAVSLDGQDTGETTPASVPLEEPYPETIVLSLAGYESVSEPVPSAEGDSVEMAFELIREDTFGRVVLSGPYPFEVWIGDRRIREAAAEHDVTLRTGEATLRILNPGYSLDRRFGVPFYP